MRFRKLILTKYKQRDAFSLKKNRFGINQTGNVIEAIRWRREKGGRGKAGALRSR